MTSAITVQFYSVREDVQKDYEGAFRAITAMETALFHLFESVKRIFATTSRIFEECTATCEGQFGEMLPAVNYVEGGVR